MQPDRYVHSWKSLAYCYYELNLRGKALSMIRMVLAIHPDDAEANQFLSKLIGKQSKR